MDKVRVGIVGSKFAADFHADAYSRNSNVELTAVAAIDNLQPFAEKWDIPSTHEDYHEMLKRDDVDLVSVCVPNFLHHDVVVAAAEAGKHVVCEKPFGINAAEAEAMIKACDGAGIKAFYAEDWVFAPALKKVGEVVSEGAIGEVLYVKAKEVHNGTHSPFAKNKKTCGGGSLIHLGIHPIGWMLYFLGQEGSNPVVEVVGKTNGGGEDNYVHKDNSGEDWACGILKFRNGVHGFIEANYITVGGMDDKIEIYGSEGRVSVDLTFSSPVNVYSRSGYSYCIEKADNTLGWTRPAVDEFHNLGYVDELAYCVACVKNDQTPQYGVSGRMGSACNRIVEALYTSSQEARTIQMEQHG